MSETPRRQRWVSKHVIDPVMRGALRLGLAPSAYALLETTGNKTGARRLTPVGNGMDGDVFWLVSERGHQAGYVRNLVANPRVRVKVRRSWRAGTATVVEDDDGRRRREQINQRNGRIGRVDGAFFNAAATAPLTIRIDLDA